VTLRRWAVGTWAILEKDVRIELRMRYAFNALLMFVLSSLLLILFSVGQEPLSARVQSALLWIVVLFSAAVGLGRAFVSEEEGGTVLLLRVNAAASMVFAGKLLFNFALVLVLNGVAFFVFVLLLGLEVRLPGLLALTFLLGAAGLAGSTTLLAAIIARTSNRATLLPVLLFPVLVPLLLSSVGATRIALAGGSWALATDELWTLTGYAGAVTTAGFLLFEYVWHD
jgi:heme exporter protein B